MGGHTGPNSISNMLYHACPTFIQAKGYLSLWHPHPSTTTSALVTGLIFIVHASFSRGPLRSFVYIHSLFLSFIYCVVLFISHYFCHCHTHRHTHTHLYAHPSDSLMSYYLMQAIMRWPLPKCAFISYSRPSVYCEKKVLGLGSLVPFSSLSLSLSPSLSTEGETNTKQTKSTTIHDLKYERNKKLHRNARWRPKEKLTPVMCPLPPNRPWLFLSLRCFFGSWHG